MNSITFGQYIPGNSWIYRLDPRMKIILMVLMIVLIFLIPNLMGMVIALGVFFLIFLSTRISVFRVIKGLRPILFLLIFTIFLQLIYTTGTAETLLYSFPMQIGLFHTLIIVGMVLFYLFTKKYIPLRFLYFLVLIAGVFVLLWFARFDRFIWNDFTFDVYKEGLNKAAFVFIRIVIMLGITSLLTFSTMFMDINNGIEAVLSPLKIIKIPVGVFSMMIALTLRFIPTLLDESKKIMNAQASRGLDFQEGNIKEKINQMIALLIPMLVISFKKADDLSDAMEARGYIIGEKRTKLDELKLKWRDYVCLVVMLGFFGLVIWSRFYV